MEEFCADKSSQNGQPAGRLRFIANGLFELTAIPLSKNGDY